MDWNEYLDGWNVDSVLHRHDHRSKKTRFLIQEIIAVTQTCRFSRPYRSRIARVVFENPSISELRAFRSNHVKRIPIVSSVSGNMCIRCPELCTKCIGIFTLFSPSFFPNLRIKTNQINTDAWWLQWKLSGHFKQHRYSATGIVGSLIIGSPVRTESWSAHGRVSQCANNSTRDLLCGLKEAIMFWYSVLTPS